MMKLRTKLDVEGTIKISHSSKVFSIGSCFSENIGIRLKQHAIHTNINPFGILYNPVSISQCLSRMMRNQPFENTELIKCDDRWVSFDHHGDYSHSDSTKALNLINDSYSKGHEFLQNADVLLITFGSSFIYALADSPEKIVSNCHKFPKDHFLRSFVDKTQIVAEYSTLIQEIRAVNPQIQIIFTLSPVRHLRDNFIENAKSKANILLAIHEIVNQTDACEYFPAYEIMMDDLRDYRFYNDDMVHPSNQAVSYIWDIFKNAHIKPLSYEVMDKAFSLFQAAQHKPLHPDTESHQQFLVKQKVKLEELKNDYPELDLDSLNQAF